MAGIGVLVVDDSVVIRRIISSVLDGDPDITVVGTAANGRIALDKLDALRPDIVILDVEMPVMDGLATLRELRRTHPTLKISGQRLAQRPNARWGAHWADRRLIGPYTTAPSCSRVTASTPAWARARHCSPSQLSASLCEGKPVVTNALPVITLASASK